ncbi:8399_t:CDS:2 [Funneliformis geosporum]|uniref:Tubulin-specific chaperone A n=1 Tax=Funneliformis geosporum TaxID=1117311 RepID=A0A9W4SU89_9GLOM|nr:18195_t:CDS:2 [Funneliformis geosporum]CAI2181736.1 8399_t:CDS:2 [Funneliformis geosporum]
MSLRDLKIKTGVVKRLYKEEKSYRKEVENQQKRIDKLTEDGTDEYTIAKQKEVLQESLNMIPDCQNRLKEAHKELQKLLENKDASWNETEELRQAEEIFEEVNKEIEI